jgi:ribosomal protein S10
MVWRPKQKKMVQKWVPKNVQQKLTITTPPTTQQATKNHQLMVAKRIISLSDMTQKNMQLVSKTARFESFDLSQKQ